ncbi:hypothetical protein COEREDRAFT_82689 [Coemansia reversa NRRL 1564]|uniref:PAS domain-containing protein n=1 Tax=Coemansia reversa (strain ATCC 12441 / NRRL 1564) TaxID=763665 RepID=A0A2G5B6E3_COERN|nr:hypothetical protein COEREDRAFT_82689 [Coemansia reversa NRRL 1564]|eukprot:PIA14562.1 hypothetical protein COEREDRAFT_82689 [Coemansia reversa NRRL 1564]
MTTDQAISASTAGQQATKPDRPTYIGIHTRDETTQILYVSSGCRQGVGFTPEYVMKQKAKDFIADEFDSNDYASVYSSKESTNPFTEEEEDEDEANAYIMYVNLKSASGTPILTRVTSFKCDNCVIYVGMAFPEIPYSNRHELEVQMLDGAMKRLNVTRERELRIEAKRRLANDPNTRGALYYARSKQVKAAFVLENPDTTGLELQETGRRPTGPLIVFVTGSVSRLIDADTSDLMSYPFLKLVAPEDVLHVGKYFERLGESTDVLFENFSLLYRPHIIEGDIFVSDEENTRIVVECLGAAVQDGVALLLRMVRSQPPPKRDSEGNYIRTKANDIEEDSGYVTLSELITSDPDTSDAPVWSKLR